MKPGRPMHEYPLEDFLPLGRGSHLLKRMRVHQQLWAWHRVNRPVGQPGLRQPFPILTAAEQQDLLTSNFHTREIHTAALNTPGLSSDEHFNHVLSSLPMAINLFGFLIDPTSMSLPRTPLDQMFACRLLTPYAPAERAHALISALMGQPVQVSRVDFEIPGRLRIDLKKHHPLRDGTSADILVEYVDKNGPGLIVIETKLTEALSNGGDLLDPTRNYRQLFDSSQSPFAQTLSAGLRDRLTADKLVQWTRNHLLAFVLEQAGRYSSHHYWVIFPESRSDVMDAAQKYRSILREPNVVFDALTLEELIAAWVPLLADPSELVWLEQFRARYVSLESSDALWTALTTKPRYARR